MAVTIVGRGEVGRTLERCAAAAHEQVRIVRRGEDPGAAALPDGPVYAAVREGDLGPLVERLAPVARRAVFPQNGWVEPALAPLGAVTRGLLWFTAKGEFFRVLAPSPFHGPQAASAAALLRAGGIDAYEEPDPRAFARELVVKLAWNAAVGLPLAVHRSPLDRYLESEVEEARAVVRETCRAAGAALGVVVDPELAYLRLRATTAELGWMTGGTKALEFRNGAVARLGRAHGVPTPVNDRLLAAIAAAG